MRNSSNKSTNSASSNKSGNNKSGNNSSSNSIDSSSGNARDDGGGGGSSQQPAATATATATTAKTTAMAAPTAPTAAASKPSYLEKVALGSDRGGGGGGGSINASEGGVGGRRALSGGSAAGATAAAAPAVLTCDDELRLEKGFVSRAVVDALLEPLAVLNWDKAGREFLIRLFQASTVVQYLFFQLNLYFFQKVFLLLSTRPSGRRPRGSSSIRPFSASTVPIIFKLYYLVFSKCIFYSRSSSGESSSFGCFRQARYLVFIFRLYLLFFGVPFLLPTGFPLLWEGRMQCRRLTD